MIVHWKKSCSGAALGLAFIFILFTVMACATPVKEFDKNVVGPQMIVQPESISLGVAALTKTDITFRGQGFQPGDSVFIKLLGVKINDKIVDIPIADANVDKNGQFIAKVGTLPKVNELLRAQIGSNEKGENVIIVTQPPIPASVYSAKAVSMESNKTAVTKLTVKGPSFMDSIKDWIGGLLGKIVKK